MAEAPRVSVVIPFYNAERTLQATIDSVVAQDYDVELILVDDGSTDNSLDIARTALGTKVMTGPNCGVSTARNRGFDASTGEWIIFLDADDLILPGTIARRMSRCSGGDVIVTDWQELEGSATVPREQVRSLPWEDVERDGGEVACVKGAWAATAALMYRREVVVSIGGFRLEFPTIQDARFMFDAFRVGARFVHASHVGALYRISPGSLSRKNNTTFWQEIFQNARQIEMLWRSQVPLSSLQRDALKQVYLGAANSLLRDGCPDYRDPLEAFRSLGGKRPLKFGVADAVARALGPRYTSRLLARGRSLRAALRSGPS